MAWDKQRLMEVTRTRLDGARLVVVANREPLIHVYEGEEIRCIRPASGLATALDPVMRFVAARTPTSAGHSSSRGSPARPGNCPRPCSSIPTTWMASPTRWPRP